MPETRSTEYEAIAKQLALLARREPEYRMHPDWSVAIGPAKLLAIVAGYAVYRRPGSAVRADPLKTWDAWTVTDKDGKPVSC